MGSAVATFRVRRKKGNDGLRAPFIKKKRPPEINSNDLLLKLLPTVDTLRNFFYASTGEMKVTAELLMKGSPAG